ncbi:hypothetical protein BGZ82_002305 [Podila clonocystis]|nr:hypothetical protein BGZ82_002305 [Podila clonocystis]
MSLLTDCGITAGMDVLAELKKRFAPGNTIPSYLQGTKCADKLCSVELDRKNCRLTWGQTVRRPLSFYTYCNVCAKSHTHRHAATPKVRMRWWATDRYSRGEYRTVEEARAAVWTVAVQGHCHGVPKFDPSNVDFLDELDARAIAASPKCFWCQRAVQVGGPGSQNNQFEVDRLVFPNDTPFADGLGALSYSDPHQKLVSSCHWCNLFFLNRSVRERVLLLDEIARNWVQSGVLGRKILEKLKQASKDRLIDSDKDTEPTPVTAGPNKNPQQKQGTRGSLSLKAPKGQLGPISQGINKEPRSYNIVKRKASDPHECDNAERNFSETDVKRAHLDQEVLVKAPERTAHASDDDDDDDDNDDNDDFQPVAKWSKTTPGDIVSAKRATVVSRGDATTGRTSTTKLSVHSNRKETYVECGPSPAFHSDANVNVTTTATSSTVRSKNVDSPVPIVQNSRENPDDSGTLAMSDVDFLALKTLFCTETGNESDEDNTGDYDEAMGGTPHTGSDSENHEQEPKKIAGWKEWKWSKRMLPSGRIVWDTEEWRLFKDISAGVSIITGRKLVNGEGHIDRIFNNLPYAIKNCLYIEMGLNFAKAQDPLFQDSSTISSEDHLEFGYNTLRQQVGSFVENTRDFRPK